MLRLATILLSVIGLCVGVYAVALTRATPPEVPLSRPPSVNPFSHGVAALGFIEPEHRVVEIAPPEPGLVTRVLVDVGDRVKAGQPLLTLDDRRVESELTRALARVTASEAEIERWNAIPRAEDIPPLEAALARAQAIVGDREDRLALVQDATARGAGSSRDVSQATFALMEAKAAAQQASAELARLRAGGWRADLLVAQAALDLARAEVQSLQILRDRLTVRAPRDSVVLRRSVEAGEYIGADPTRPALILGDLEQLVVRAQVDEEDIALVGEAPKALARTRGARPTDLSVTLVRIEPFARPKSDLKGINAERVDTRVIDVLFRIERAPGVPLFPGQALDVFIEVTD